MNQANRSLQIQTGFLLFFSGEVLKKETQAHKHLNEKGKTELPQLVTTNFFKIIVSAFSVEQAKLC